eukprot:jgi/Bigna1/134256/aug1.24_g8964
MNRVLMGRLHAFEIRSRHGCSFTMRIKIFLESSEVLLTECHKQETKIDSQSEEIIYEVIRMNYDLNIVFYGVFLTRRTSLNCDKAVSFWFGGKEFKERIRFYDRAFLTLKAGTGGNGNKSFITDRYGNKLPDGERGGDGGDVILQACSHQQALKFESFHHMGKKGENGKSNNKRGRKGADYVIKVPIGTVVKRVHRDEETRERSFSDVIADLTEESQRFCAAKGGKGGQGNVSFKTKTQFTVADIPGLIEGASEGRGLGHHFLRHIERVKVLLFVLDGASSDFRCPAEDLHQLITELNTYSPKIAQRPALVFLNKNDIDEGVFEHNEQKVRATSPFEVVVGTAAEENAIGMQDVIDKLHDLLRKADPENFPTYTRRHS